MCPLHCADRVGEARRNADQGNDRVTGVLQLSDGGSLGYPLSVSLQENVKDTGGIDECSDLGRHSCRHGDGKVEGTRGERRDIDYQLLLCSEKRFNFFYKLVRGTTLIKDGGICVESSHVATSNGRSCLPADFFKFLTFHPTFQVSVMYL